AVAVDAAGCVYVTDFALARIQKFTAEGAYLTQWGASGVGAGLFFAPNGTAVDANGSIWVADYQYNYVQKFASAPELAYVSDVAGDQGGQARLRILRSSADAAGSGVTLTGYAIYRRVDPGFAAAPAGALAQAGDAGAGRPGPDGVQLVGYDYLTTQPATGDPEYSMVVPTIANANAASTNYSGFLVRALTSVPTTSFSSANENGYSIDNLSPGAPTGFAAAFTVGATQMHWNPSAAPDFGTFRLYRGASADFVPGAGNLVATVADTAYADVGASGFYYKLSAVDFNGNESPYASLGPGQTTDAGPSAAAVAFVLNGARPNPARGGRVSIAFALPTGAAARLELIDLAGRRVLEREVGSLGAGEHVVNFAAGAHLAPGIYLARLTQGAASRSARIAVIE
ncbi:MAG: T9SS type A sorting domain-containing protein, partial [Candidatus Eiseniibacteriota bacterium]